MQFEVINTELPDGQNVLQHLVNTFNDKGELMSTRISSDFSSEDEALEYMKTKNLEPSDTIKIIPKRKLSYAI